MSPVLEAVLKAVDFEAMCYHEESRKLESDDLAGRLYLNAKYTVRLVDLIESVVAFVVDTDDEDEKHRVTVLIAYIKGRLEGVRDVEEIMNLTLRKKD